jgi:nitroimidazol reductase NimA-like FMN-containing flavoprotein (pyridoxamine 5'-phosphate oxidase superfamily)
LSETKTNDTGEQSAESWRGKVGVMSDEERDEFLGGGNLARIAVIDDNGWPYVQPIWFHWDPAEGVFYVVARKKSAWALHMKNNPKVALTIDGENRPYKKVTVQGAVEVIEEPNVGGQWVEIAKKMSVRYLGEHGPSYMTPTLDKPRWLFKIVPTFLSTWQGVEWANKYKE